MTTELGPRDVELRAHERFAGRFLRGWAWVLTQMADDTRARFDASTATLVLSGESEHSGDPFARGRSVAAIVAVHLLATIGSMGMIGVGLSGLQPATTGAVVVSVLALIYTAVVGVSYFGAISMSSKIDVVDHTTEPAPEELDALKAEFVDGEIDEQELGERAAEVWER